MGTELLAAGQPNSVALVDADPSHPGAITYAELAARVDERAGRLGLVRRSLVVVAASNSVEFVVTYLALLRDGHVPLLAGRHVERLAEWWNADAVVRPDGAGPLIEHLRPSAAAAHQLHPDLALLMSTSGSTGEAKLVRLSETNVLSNAASIGTYLGLSRQDRGITSLPLHYCYGLSILHSHLLAGASVVVTSASVIDPCFARAMQDHNVTNLAGVPHTFELLDRAGADLLRTPSLRLVTQAGGRLAPEKVTRWVAQAMEWDAEFYVMYGQTEATARMAYLPPSVARRRPGCIGVAIPGGQLSLRPVEGMDDDGVGELVYRGPNVMMGYATSAPDLALGATLTELATGDLGRFHADDGVFEVVGRVSRFVKPMGVRVDLQRVEEALAGVAPELAAGGDDERLVVVAPGGRADDIRAAVADLTGLPRSLTFVETERDIPRTDSGKVDYAAVAAMAAPASGDAAVAADGPHPQQQEPGADGRSVAAVYRFVLGAPFVSPGDTFVSLGGDSLNYVECSTRLERVLGRLPVDWHVLTVAELEAARPRPPRSTLDTTVVMRAIGICAIVSTHMKLLWFPGGAHLLLAVVGFNFSRFQLPITSTADRVRAGLRSAGRAAFPAVVWVAVGIVLVDGYSWPTLGLVNNYLGPPTHGNGRWHYWFLEVFVHLLVLATLLLAIGPVRRRERRSPYLFALAAFVVSLVFRYRLIEIDGVVNLRFRTHGVAWFFALGWLAQQSRATWQRLLTTALCVVTIPGFFHRPEREWFVVAGVVVMLWWREIPVPRLVRPAITAVAAASIWIFISHFRVFPPLVRNLPDGLAYAATIAVGVVLAWLVGEVGRRLRHVSPAPAARLTTAWRHRPVPVMEPVRTR